MKKQQLFLFTGCCAAGLLCGYAGKRLNSPQATAAAIAAEGASSKTDRGSSTDAAGPAGRAARRGGMNLPVSSVKSTETLESLKADESNLYARLAVWMLDASEEDIAAYWQHYRAKGERSNDINDIIFINWTRLNPQAATAAAKGTPDEHYAWWAWACHDPQTALAEAIAKNPDRVNNVTWGIGEFHPAWLREHFDELPEGSRSNALRGMAKWDDHADPEATLKFLQEKGHGFSERIFKVLAQRDPWAAYDWLEKNGPTANSDYGDNDVMGPFVATLGKYHPDVLERIAQMSPNGELRRKMESAAFAGLVETDPEAAIAQAKETKGPAIAAERYARVGLALLKSDPDRAFEMAAGLLKIAPDVTGGGMTINYEQGSSSYGSSSNEPWEFMNGLMSIDPARVMDMFPLAAGAPTHVHYDAFQQMAGRWEEVDREGFITWLDGQSEGPKRLMGESHLIHTLSGAGEFESAAQRAMGLGKHRDMHLTSIMSGWRSSNPEAARAWLAAAGLPAEGFREFEGPEGRTLPEE